ncbi:hypothetical protein PSAC2689_170127 [Paraburkholderia sacchari]
MLLLCPAQTRLTGCLRGRTTLAQWRCRLWLFLLLGKARRTLGMDLYSWYVQVRVGDPARRGGSPLAAPRRNPPVCRHWFAWEEERRPASTGLCREGRGKIPWLLSSAKTRSFVQRWARSSAARRLRRASNRVLSSKLLKLLRSPRRREMAAVWVVSAVLVTCWVSC